MILQEYFFKDALDKLVFYSNFYKKKKIFWATWWKCSLFEEGGATLYCLFPIPSLQQHQPSQARCFRQSHVV